MSDKKKIRLYVNLHLARGGEVCLGEEQSHYLCNVMRLGAGTEISCFNANDGEFAAVIETPHKKQTCLRIGEQRRLPRPAPDVWLLFAPLKKDRSDYLVEKAVELGAAALMPVITRFSITDKIRPERLQAQMAEAAEQCERLDVPALLPATSLPQLLKNWPAARTLFFMDERGTGTAAADAFAAESGKPAAILIGPEGGFAPEEAELLYQCPFVRPVSLGPRILRAETAAAAALAVWQAQAGDWKEK